MRLSLAGFSVGLIALLTVGCGDDGASDRHVWDDTDQCLSAQDHAIVDPWQASRLDGGSLDAGAMDGGVAEVIRPGQIVGACIRTSAATGDEFDCFEPLVHDRLDEGRACVNDCIDESVLSGALTPGCQDCFIDWIFCGGTNCAVPCIADNASECELCLFDVCGDQLDICIGY